MKCHHGVNPAMSEAVSAQCSAALGMAAHSVLMDLLIKSPLPVIGTCIMRETAPEQSGSVCHRKEKGTARAVCSACSSSRAS